MVKGLKRWFNSATEQSPGAVPVKDPGIPNSAGSHAVSVSIDELIALKSSVRGISLMTTRVKNSSITGAHASRFRGRGMDYQESRAYQPGDDIRSMDWRVTARAGQPYVKMYEEERERPVMLLIDFNPGMFFASQGVFKSVMAARIAALIAWAGVANGDRIGGLVFNGMHRELLPRGGSKGALHFFRFLVEASDPVKGMQASMEDTESSGLDSALKRCRRVVKPGSLIFILSDFYHMSEDIKAQLLLLRQHNDVVAIQLTDPLELSPPPAAVYGISDGEHKRIIDTRIPKQHDSYKHWCDEHQEIVEQVMRKRAIPLLRISTTDDAAVSIRQFMSSTRKRSSNRAGIKVAV